MKYRLSFFKNQLTSTGDHIKKGSVFPILTGLLLLMVLSYILYIPPRKSIEDPKLSVGDIIQNDIVIKEDLTILDEEQTKLNREAALDQVLPVYQFLPDYKKKRTDLINSWIEYLRTTRKEFLKDNNALITIKETIEHTFGITLTEQDISHILRSNIHSRIDVSKFLNFIDQTDRSGVVPSKAGTRKGKDGTIKVVLPSGISRIEKVSDLLDLNELRELLVAHFRSEQNFNAIEARKISSILIEFINVNLTFSANLTADEVAVVI